MLTPSKNMNSNRVAKVVKAISSHALNSFMAQNVQGTKVENALQQFFSSNPNFLVR